MEGILGQKSFLDFYVRLKYIDFIRECSEKMPGEEPMLAQRGYEIIKENIKIKPLYTRNWLIAGTFTTFLADKEKNAAKKESLIKEATDYFVEAQELSPKRQEIYDEWIKLDLVSGQYQQAMARAKECLSLNPDFWECHWLLGLAQAFSGAPQAEVEKSLAVVRGMGFDFNNPSVIGQLIKAYTVSKNYPELAKQYQLLIQLEPDNAQLHAELAFIFRELKEYKKAEAEALKALELLPSAQAEVEEFLKTLPLK